MDVNYVLMNPTGNRTILVTTPVDKKRYKTVAGKLMEKEPTAEQVGFLDISPSGLISLNMAGGEFCGNATMSAAAYAVAKDLSESPVQMKVSGAKSRLRVEIAADGAYAGSKEGGGLQKETKTGRKGAVIGVGGNHSNVVYTGLVKMPAPVEIKDVRLPLGGEMIKLPAVVFDGITHIILSGFGIAKKQAEKCVRKWCEELDVPCLGLMFYDATKNRLKPLVYVKNPETLFWENSCGSGSVALAAYLAAHGNRNTEFEFAEPGGRITVIRKGKTFYLKGKVFVEKEGTEEIAVSKKKSTAYDPKLGMTIIKRFEQEYGTDYTCYLHHENAWQLLFATIMSAQCTDERVNLVTKDLYAKYPSLDAFANADLKELEQDIHSTGFYHNKAKNIIACAKELIEKYNGEVPSDIEALTSLPGVGRKTANVIRGNIYHIDSIVVDTHVKRISRKLGFTTEEDPVRIEFDLMEKVPKEYWILINIHFIRLGRTICKAPTPKCGECFLKDVCPSAAG